MMCVDEDDGENFIGKELGIVGSTQPGRVVVRGTTAHDFKPLRNNFDGDNGGDIQNNLPQNEEFYMGRRENQYWYVMRIVCYFMGGREKKSVP